MRSLRTFTLLPGALLLGLAGCAREGPPAFPLGVFDVSRPSDLPLLRKAGFNSFQSFERSPGTLEALAREAKKQKLWMIPYPTRLLEGAPDRLGERVLAWFVRDEPEATKTPRDQVREEIETVRRWDPEVPTALVIGDGRVAKDFADLPDILALDWYPVPHLPLRSVAQHMAFTRKHLPAGRPLWVILQAFDWRDAPQRSFPKIGRFPSFQEIRLMTFLALVHGAQGVFFYSFNRPMHPRQSLADYPEHAQAVFRVVRQVRAFLPILESGVDAPAPFQTADLEFRVWKYRGRRYVVLTNPDPENARIVPEELYSLRWRPLFEPRRRLEDLLSKQGAFLALEPHGVLVLEEARF